MIKKSIYFFLLLVSQSIFCADEINHFIITAFDDRFQVQSPIKFINNVEVYIENKTLSKLIGKFEINNVNNKNFASVKPNTFSKFNFKLNKNDKLVFIPLSPSFQEISLLFGNKLYEIPAKK